MNGYYDFDCGFANKAGRIGNQFGQVAYAPDGKLEFRANGASGKVVERRTGHPFGYELHCEAAIKEAFFSSDSSKLAIADSHAVTLVAAESGLPICDPIHGDAIIRTLRISQDASRILILREQGVVTLWDKQLGRHLDHKKTELGRLCQTETIQDITLSPSGEFVVAKCIGNPVAFVFSALDGRLIVQTDPQYGVPARVQFSGDGRRFLVGSSDSRARVWSLDS